MSLQEVRRQRREQRISVMAERLSKPGEFIHLDRRTPRLASGAIVSKTMLRELERRGVVAVAQLGLDGRPMQFAAPRAVRQFPESDCSGNGHVWSLDRRAAALALWMAGETKAEVARRFNTSRGFIVRMARVDKWPATR